MSTVLLVGVNDSVSTVGKGDDGICGTEVAWVPELPALAMTVPELPAVEPVLFAAPAWPGPFPALLVPPAVLPAVTVPPGSPSALLPARAPTLPPLAVPLEPPPVAFGIAEPGVPVLPGAPPSWTKD